MAVFIVRSGRNILPATSQPSTNEMTDVRLARGRPGDGVQAREAAQARWRAVNAPHRVALVRAGARFANGYLVERPDESGGEAQAA